MNDRNPELQTYYDTHVAPLLKATEPGRRLSVRMGGVTVIFTCIALAMLVIGINTEWLMDTSGYLWTFLSGIGAAAVSGVLFYHFYTRFRSEYRRLIVPAAIQYVMPDLEYSEDEYVPKQYLEESMFFDQSIDRYSGANRVNGLCRHTEIQFSEICAETRIETQQKGKKKKVEWKQVFKGILWVADFNKNFQTKVIVMPHKPFSRLLDLGRSVISENGYWVKNRLKLENPEFNEMFSAYGEDPVESRYILSLPLMEQMVEYRQTMKRDVYISFISSRMCVAVPREGGLYEPSLLRTNCSMNRFRSVVRDVSIGVSLVDAFHLNTRIWAKK